MPIRFDIFPDKTNKQELRAIRLLSKNAASSSLDSVVRRILANTANSDDLSNPTVLTAFSLTPDLDRQFYHHPGQWLSIRAAGEYRILTATTTLQINANFSGGNNLCSYAALPVLGVTSGTTFRPWTIEIHVVPRTIASGGTSMIHAVYNVYNETNSLPDTIISATNPSINWNGDLEVRILAAFGASNNHIVRLLNICIEYSDYTIR